jgi:hypothetical protein
VEGAPVPILPKSDEKLKIRGFPDAFHQLLVGASLSPLDEQRARRDANGKGGTASARRGKPVGVECFNLFPRDESGQFHPAVLEIETSAERLLERLDF